MSSQGYTSVGGGGLYGNVYQTPKNYYIPVQETMDSLVDFTGQSRGDIQSQIQNGIRFSQRWADALSGGGNGSGVRDLMAQFEPETYMQWLNRHGGQEQNITEPATKLYNDWMAKMEPSLKDAAYANNSQLVRSGDVSANSRVFDQNHEADYLKQRAQFAQAAAIQSAQPFIQGVNSGYANYGNALGSIIGNAFQAAMMPYNTYMGAYNTALQANAGGWGGQTYQLQPPQLSVAQFPGGPGVTSDKDLKPPEPEKPPPPVGSGVTG